MFKVLKRTLIERVLLSKDNICFGREIRTIFWIWFTANKTQGLNISEPYTQKYESCDQK